MAELLNDEEIESRLISVHGWNKVRLALTNHPAGALTEADFALADRIDGLG